VERLVERRAGKKARARFLEVERKKLLKEKAKLEEEIEFIKRDRSLTEDTKAQLIKVLKDVRPGRGERSGKLETVNVPGRFCCPEVSPNL